MKKFLYSFIMSMLVCICVQGYGLKTQSEISNNILRLHIIANSNNITDQELKLKVRDNIINNVSVSDSDFILKCKRIANETVETSGYSAKAEYGNFYFPTKKYNNFTLPCGNYNAIKIVLGEGKGKNWWCVLYPPMCLNNKNVTMDKYSATQLETTLSQDSYQLITDNKNQILIKFKTIEIVNELLNIIDNL